MSQVYPHTGLSTSRLLSIKSHDDCPAIPKQFVSSLQNSRTDMSYFHRYMAASYLGDEKSCIGHSARSSLPGEDDQKPRLFFQMNNRLSLTWQVKDDFDISDDQNKNTPLHLEPGKKQVRKIPWQWKHMVYRCSEKQNRSSYENPG